MLDALARALKLSDAERAHLHRLAGQAGPAAGAMRRELTPSIRRIIDRLGDVPVSVSDAAWTHVSCNGPAQVLLGSPLDEHGAPRNVARDHFLGLEPRLVEHTQGEEDFAASIVASLHEALGRFPDDAPLRALVDELLAGSDEFRELWERRPVGAPFAQKKVIHHPAIGSVTVDCDVLRVDGSDLWITVYTAPPGTDDAEALAMLGSLDRASLAG